MKTKPGRFCLRMVRLIGRAIIVSAVAFLSVDSHADGCFVVPKFVWDKHKDINEPTQKAIIAYDSGREDLILQVKYGGPVEEFGWLIPVPNVPTVKKGSMDCFYELSKFTQKKFEFDEFMTMSAKGEDGAMPAENEVKVIEVKTVGAYKIAVLSAKDAGALQNWLSANQFVVPADKTDVIDSYVKQGWYFVAAKIDLGRAGFELVSGPPRSADGAQAKIAEKLSEGELYPLHLSFASKRCVFPLKISSVNGKASEVSVYLLSTVPLVEKALFEKKLTENYYWRSNGLATLEERSDALFSKRQGGLAVPPGRRPEEPHLATRSWINDDELIPYAQVSRTTLPVCSREIALLREKRPWLMKQVWTFQPGEMRDLEFVPALPVFVSSLTNGEGTFAAANLAKLGTDGEHALLAALNSKNSAVRAHVLAGMELGLIGREHRDVTSQLAKRLPALLGDADPEVRLHALNAVSASEDRAVTDRVFELLGDDNAEVSDAAEHCLLGQREEVSKRLPLLRQMLHQGNSNAQTAALRLMLHSGVAPSRGELLPLFSVPRMEVASVAANLVERNGGHITCSEAKPLLENSFWMVRLSGLLILYNNMSSESVEAALPLLKDKEEYVRVRTRDMLADMTGQDFGAEQFEQWNKWWAENKATFVPSRDQVEQRRVLRMRGGNAAMQSVRDPSLPE